MGVAGLRGQRIQHFLACHIGKLGCIVVDASFDRICIIHSHRFQQLLSTITLMLLSEGLPPSL